MQKNNNARTRRSRRRKVPQNGQQTGFKSPHSAVSPFNGAGIPPRLVTSLRWTFGPAYAATSSTYGETIFSGASANDPGSTSASTKPIGYSEMALWYNTYRVLKARIMVECSTISTSTTPVATAVETSWVLYANGSTSAVTDYKSAIGQTGALVRKSELGKPCTLSMAGDHKSVLGVKSTGYDSGTALTNADPNANWFFHLGSISPAAYTLVSSQIQLTIEYTVEFFNRTLMNLSLVEPDKMKHLEEQRTKFQTQTRPMRLGHLSLQVGDVSDNASDHGASRHHVAKSEKDGVRKFDPRADVFVPNERFSDLTPPSSVRSKGMVPPTRYVIVERDVEDLALPPMESKKQA